MHLKLKLNKKYNLHFYYDKEFHTISASINYLYYYSYSFVKIVYRKKIFNFTITLVQLDNGKIKL